eukprot:6190000-Pleurochrysis_carterae.AAC.3
MLKPLALASKCSQCQLKEVWDTAMTPMPEVNGRVDGRGSGSCPAVQSSTTASRSRVRRERARCK